MTSVVSAGSPTAEDGATEDTLEAGNWPSAKTGWYAVGILAAAQAFSGLDRNVLNILVEPIKADLGASDAQMGLLLGFAFAIFYTSMALPMGRLADRASRKTVIGLGMTFWCMATAACGMAWNYMSLFFARMSVGIGEASLNPAAFSLIADYFPPKKRGAPLSAFIGSQSIGSALAIFGGGAILQYFAVTGAQVSLPLVGDLAPWQVAFLCASIPGLVVAMLVFTIREPERKNLAAGETSAGPQDEHASVADVIKHLTENRGIYLPLFGSLAALMFVELGRGAWTPSFFIRALEFTPAQVGVTMGLILLICPPVAVLLCGAINERLARTRKVGDSMFVAMVAIALLAPFMISSTLVDSPALAIGLMIPQYLLSIFPLVMAPAAIALVAPNRLRGQITAVYLLSINLVGYGLGPAFVGFLSDEVFTSADGLRYSMATTATIGLPIVVLLLFVAILRINKRLTGIN